MLMDDDKTPTHSVIGHLIVSDDLKCRDDPEKLEIMDLIFLFILRETSPSPNIYACPWMTLCNDGWRLFETPLLVRVDPILF